MSDSTNLGGRPKRAIPGDRWTVVVDQDVALFWRLYLWDEIEQAPRKGSMSELTTRLLRDEMNRVKAAEGRP